MKLPTWAIFVGIIMILFGGCGTLSNVQKIVMPQQLEMQKEMMESFESIHIETTEYETADTLKQEMVITNNEDTTKLSQEFPSETFEKLFFVDKKEEQLLVSFGYIGLFLSLFYILAGVFLLLHRKESIRIAVAMIGISILFILIQSIVLFTMGESYMIKLSGSFGFVGIIAHLILLTVILIKRDHYYPQGNLQPNASE